MLSPMAINEHNSSGENERDSQFSQADLPRIIFELKNQVERLGAANRELTDKEELLRLSVETGRVGVWVWDTVGSVHSLGWSDRLKEIFGLPRGGDVTRELFLKCVHPEDRERIDWAIMQALAGVNEGFYNVEYRIVHPEDNSVHWVTAQGQAFFNASGQSIRFIGAVVDISDRKQVEEFTARLNLELESRISERVRALETTNKTLETEVRERINLEQQLRESQTYLAESQQLARGQLDSLKTTLAKFSQESEPEKLLEHVLRIITEQLNAHSLSIWEINETIGRSVFLATFEDDKLQLASKEIELPSKASPSAEEHPVWTRFFRDGDICVSARLDTDPPQVRIENGQENSWYDWRVDASDDPLLVAMIEHLAGLGIISTLNVPRLIAGEVVGHICARFKERRTLRREEIELTRALSHQATLAIQLMRLSLHSRQSAVIAERNRMARDIHDTLAQGFTGIIAQLQAAKGAGSLAEASAHIGRAEDLARWSLGEARRSVRAIRPRSLREATLSMALESMLKTVASDSGLKTEFIREGEERPIPPEWEEGLLRVVQESLTNTVKHARSMKFHATLTFEPEKIRLQLVDEGQGFDPEAEHEGFGLIGMKERIHQMGGEFAIRSQAGRGTETVITLRTPATAKPGNE
jgi:PAS domain S-box-containing protein